MGLRVAQLDTVFRADTREIDRATASVDKRLKDTATGAVGTGRKFGGAFSAMGRAATGLGGHLASAGIALAMNSMANEASHLGEVVDFTTQVFGKNADAMEAWGGTTLDTIGAAKVTALDAANGFGVLFNAADLTGDAVVEMSQGLVQLAGDMSSAKDVPLEEALMAIRSGLVGESEPLRRFGILLNETAVKERALAMGLVESGEELSESAKTQARYNLILGEGEVYAGNYADTADSMANKQRKASQAMLEAKATMGEELAPILATVYGQLSDVLGLIGDLPPAVNTAVLSLMSIGVALPYIVRTAQAVGTLSSAMKASTIAGGAMGAPITAARLGLMDLGGKILPRVTSTLGQTAVGIGAVTAVTVAGTVAIDKWSQAIQAGKDALAEEHKYIESGADLVSAYGEQLKAGIITEDEFTAKVRASAPALQEHSAGLLGALEDVTDFATGEKSAGEVAAERAAILNRGKEVLKAYAAEQKVTTSVVVDGHREQRQVSVASLKAQWRFLDMNLEQYRNWADGTKDALNGVRGKLSDLAGRAKLTAGQITRAFAKQLKDQKAYAANWGDILDRGIAKKAPELTAQLQEMGLEGAGIVNALSDANKREFQKIISQWEDADRISDRTSTAIIRHTEDWTGRTRTNMAGAVSQIGAATDELVRLGEVAGGLGAVDIDVTMGGKMPTLWEPPTQGPGTPPPPAQGPPTPAPPPVGPVPWSTDRVTSSRVLNETIRLTLDGRDVTTVNRRRKVLLRDG